MLFALSSLVPLFHDPWLLALLGLAPVVVLVQLWRRRQRLKATAILLGGHQGATVDHRRRWLRSACGVSALVLTVVGSAGPQWGRDPHAPPLAGRDILVLLDVSRSMLAEDRPPQNRLERAKSYLGELASSLQRRGGYRLGLIAFAGQARVLCHLTEDCDAFRYAVEEAHPDRLGVAGRIGYKEDGTSFGTSLRGALELAMATQDPRFQGYQEILLVSDGDDLEDDWRVGAELARRAATAVHALGVGDPERDAFIPTGRSDMPYLLYEGEKVRTRRRDAVLAELARRTSGAFLTEDQASQPLIYWFQTRIADLPVREWTDDQRPILVQRYGWFFGLAMLLLAAAMVLGEAGRNRVT